MFVILFILLQNNSIKNIDYMVKNSKIRQVIFAILMKKYLSNHLDGN